MRKFWTLTCLVLAFALLAGCNMTTVDKLYSLPKRSEEYTNLQSVMEKAMAGLEHSAPLNGENQQTVQMADLDGDGEVEYLLFAKGNSTERPLRILIFTGSNGQYRLLDTIECNGTTFDQVDYVRMDPNGGVELIVGRQVSDQVLRSLSVYRLVDGQMEQILTTNYTRFLTADLNSDNKRELFVIRPSEGNATSGIAELYSIANGQVVRSQEVPMSGPADKIKRIIPGKLNDKVSAVFVASDVDGTAIMTDVYAMVGGQLSNISMSSDSGTSVQTLRNYYIYADDIDNDGVLELPNLLPAKPIPDSNSQETQYIIRWYALNSDGTSVDREYTYHNLAGGWYIQLDDALASRFAVEQKGNSYEFYLWDEDFAQTQKLMTLYVLTGQKREEQAVADNRFPVYRSETTIYAVNLETASAVYGLTQEKIISGFHLIVQDWNTGLT